MLLIVMTDKTMLCHDNELLHHLSLWFGLPTNNELLFNLVMYLFWCYLNSYNVWLLNIHVCNKNQTIMHVWLWHMFCIMLYIYWMCLMCGLLWCFDSTILIIDSKNKQIVANIASRRAKATTLLRWKSISLNRLLQFFFTF